jgi:hypothetical protein
MDLLKNEKFKKLVFLKLSEDLSDKIFKPFAGEFWVIDPIDNKWFLSYSNNGNLQYNQIFFSSFFRLFSLQSNEYQIILKEWFEFNFDLVVNQLQRRNTNYDYFVINIINNEKPWSIKNRYGFGYYFVKKYLDLKQNIQEMNIVLENFIKNHNTIPIPK